MNSLMAPIWFASFLEKDNASRTKRDTRYQIVERARALVFEAEVRLRVPGMRRHATSFLTIRHLFTSIRHLFRELTSVPGIRQTLSAA